MIDVPPARKVMPDATLDKAEFKRRLASQFFDPAFDGLARELDAVAEAAWDGYAHSRKSPRTRKAGEGYADPGYDLAIDWIEARAAIDAAQLEHDGGGPPRVLLVNGSPRSENTCPGESSKSWRLVDIARAALEDAGARTEVLDLSRLASEYGRNIHPCKACFSTAAALCHWPCSCYPNYSLGQTQDWMNEIYPMWVRAHGVMIVSPVHWYAPSSPIKLMMDRMVCADGGNPDPTSTHGKTVAEAKALELQGWPYPRHLAGRLFSVIVHGDVEGANGVRHSLGDWLRFMQLEPAGLHAEIDRYIGYWQPYATSHDALDRDLEMQGEVRQAAATLVEALNAKNERKWTSAGAWLTPPRQK
jgi:multimeric flavodoxin WrbA